MQIEKIDFYGMSAIHFEAGGYEAIMIPEIGANVVKLSHKASGTNILRTPAEDEIETFKGRPQVASRDCPPDEGKRGKGRCRLTRFNYLPILLRQPTNYPNDEVMVLEI